MTACEGLRVYAKRQSQPGIGYVAGVLTSDREGGIVVVEWQSGGISEEIWGVTVAPCRQ